MPFPSFSCLIAPNTASSAMLNRSDESRHFCSVYNLRGNAFSFTRVQYFYHGFLYEILLSWGSAPVFTICWVFLSWKDVEYCQMFFCSIEMTILPFIFLMWLITFIKFYVELSLHSKNESHLVMVYKPSGLELCHKIFDYYSISL